MLCKRKRLFRHPCREFEPSLLWCSVLFFRTFERIFFGLELTQKKAVEEMKEAVQGLEEIRELEEGTGGMIEEVAFGL